MIAYTCPICGNVKRLADDLAGRRVQCKKCGTKGRADYPVGKAAEPSGKDVEDLWRDTFGSEPAPVSVVEPPEPVTIIKPRPRIDSPEVIVPPPVIVRPPVRGPRALSINTCIGCAINVVQALCACIAIIAATDVIQYGHAIFLWFSLAFVAASQTAALLWAVIDGRGKGAETALWVIVVLMVPVLGLFAYLVASRGPWVLVTLATVAALIGATLFALGAWWAGREHREYQAVSAVDRVLSAYVEARIDHVEASRQLSGLIAELQNDRVKGVAVWLKEHMDSRDLDRQQRVAACQTARRRLYKQDE